MANPEAEENALDQFLAATGCSPEQGQFFLEATGGDWQQAVSVYFGRA
jgi:UBA-like domain